MGYPFGEIGSAVLAMFPPKVLLTTSQVVKRGDVGETLIDALGAKISCVYQHLSSYQYKSQNYEGCYGDN